MKKVLCNVLYEVIVPVCDRELGDVPLNLGLFDDYEDAEIAGMITKKILENPEDFNYLEVGSPSVQNEYIPDSEMDSSRVASRFHKDLNDFAVKDAFVAYFIDKYGLTALEMMVCDCMDEIKLVEDSKDQKGE